MKRKGCEKTENASGYKIIKSKSNQFKTASGQVVAGAMYMCNNCDYSNCEV